MGSMEPLRTTTSIGAAIDHRPDRAASSGGAAVHIESSSPPCRGSHRGAVEGFNRLSFGLSVAHDDPPPPDTLGDLNELAATDRFRFVNRLPA